MVDVAGAQEIGVQRVHVAAVVDRGLCRGQRLASTCPPNTYLVPMSRLCPREQVVLQPLQREQVYQLGDDGFGRVVQGGGQAVKEGLIIPVRGSDPFARAKGI